MQLLTYLKVSCLLVMQHIVFVCLYVKYAFLPQSSLSVLLLFAVLD